MSRNCYYCKVPLTGEGGWYHCKNRKCVAYVGSHDETPKPRTYTEEEVVKLKAQTAALLAEHEMKWLRALGYAEKPQFEPGYGGIGDLIADSPYIEKWGDLVGEIKAQAAVMLEKAASLPHAAYAVQKLGDIPEECVRRSDIRDLIPIDYAAALAERDALIAHKAVQDYETAHEIELPKAGAVKYGATMEDAIRSLSVLLDELKALAGTTISQIPNQVGWSPQFGHKLR